MDLKQDRRKDRHKNTAHRKQYLETYRKQYYKNAEHRDADNARKRRAYKEKRGYRLKNFKRLYNLTLQEYDDLYNKQNGRCAICGQHKEKAGAFTKGINVICIDHNHKTGMLRGLLCRTCNAVLGNAYDSIEILKSAIDYLIYNDGPQKNPTISLGRDTNAGILV